MTSAYWGNVPTMSARARVAARGLILFIALSLAGCEPRRNVEEVAPEFEGRLVASPPDRHLIKDVMEDMESRVYSINRRAQPYSVYLPVQDKLEWDAGSLFRALGDCEKENCQMALASQNQDYLIEVVRAACSEKKYGPLPARGAMSLYLYVDAKSQITAREAILPCRQHVTMVDRASKKTLGVFPAE